MSDEWTRDDLPSKGDMAVESDEEEYGAGVALAAILDHLNQHYRKVPK